MPEEVVGEPLSVPQYCEIILFGCSYGQDVKDTIFPHFTCLRSAICNTESLFLLHACPG